MTVFLFSMPFISLIYCFSFIFDKAESAFKYTILLFMIVYLVPMLIQSFVTTTALTDTLAVIFPTSTLTTNISDILDPSKNTDGYGSMIFIRCGFLILQSICYMTIAILIDNRQIHSFIGMDNNPQAVQRKQLDERQDVLQHKDYTIQNYGNKNRTHLIKAKNIKKVYSDGVAAVNDNTFCVKKGEVFGLLGPNGAGKSSMFNIMTMDLKRSEGDVQILDTDIDDLNVT